MKGPAAALEMDGRAHVLVHVFPRPTAKERFEPYCVSFGKYKCLYFTLAIYLSLFSPLDSN